MWHFYHIFIYMQSVNLNSSTSNFHLTNTRINLTSVNSKIFNMYTSIKVDWSKTLVFHLIDLWKMHDCLYNPENKFYHNKKVRYETLSKMARELKAFAPNIEPNAIKHKITYLRGQYTRELAKQRADDYTSNAFWFEKMSFLDDYVKVRKSETSQPFSIDDCQDSSIELDLMPTDVKSNIMVEVLPPISGYSRSSPHSKKRSRMDNEMSACHALKEDLILDDTTVEDDYSDIVTINPNVPNNRREMDRAFANFVRAELSTVTDESIRDDLIETITIAIFDAKRRQKNFNNSLNECDL